VGRAGQVREAVTGCGPALTRSSPEPARLALAWTPRSASRAGRGTRPATGKHRHSALAGPAIENALKKASPPKKASTLAIYVGRISRHIKPLIGKLLVGDIDTRTAKGLIHDITVGKTATDLKTKKRGWAIVKGGAATAASVADVLSGVMSWAIDEGVIERNRTAHRTGRFTRRGSAIHRSPFRGLRASRRNSLGRILRHRLMADEKWL